MKYLRTISVFQSSTSSLCPVLKHRLFKQTTYVLVPCARRLDISNLMIFGKLHRRHFIHCSFTVTLCGHQNDAEPGFVLVAPHDAIMCFQRGAIRFMGIDSKTEEEHLFSPQALASAQRMRVNQIVIVQLGELQITVQIFNVESKLVIGIEHHVRTGGTQVAVHCECGISQCLQQCRPSDVWCAQYTDIECVG